jgi:hypothetical protein
MHTMEAVDIENHEGKKGGKISTYKLEGAGPCFANNPKVVAFLMRRNFACSNGSEAGECRNMLDRSWTGLVAVDCDDESGAIKSSAGTSSIFGGTSAQSMCKTSHCVFSIDQHAPSSPLAQLYTISHQKTLLFLLSTKHHIFLLSIRC